MNPLLHVIGPRALRRRRRCDPRPVDTVGDSESLSRLYGFPIEVVRAAGRVFVVLARGAMWPSWLVTMDTIISYLGYAFVWHALIAGTLSAILGAVVGYFVVLRNINFAAHALSHIGLHRRGGGGVFGLESRCRASSSSRWRRRSASARRATVSSAATWPSAWCFPSRSAWARCSCTCARASPGRARRSSSASRSACRRTRSSRWQFFRWRAWPCWRCSQRKLLFVSLQPRWRRRAGSRFPGCRSPSW